MPVTFVSWILFITDNAFQVARLLSSESVKMPFLSSVDTEEESWVKCEGFYKVLRLQPKGCMWHLWGPKTLKVAFNRSGEVQLSLLEQPLHCNWSSWEITLVISFDMETKNLKPKLIPQSAVSQMKIRSQGESQKSTIPAITFYLLFIYLTLVHQTLWHKQM